MNLVGFVIAGQHMHHEVDPEAKGQFALPFDVSEEEMERDEALHDYARRVASGHAYKPGEHPEDGKDVAF